MAKEIISVDIKSVTFKEIKNLVDTLIEEGKNVSIDDMETFDAHEIKACTWLHKLNNFDKELKAAKDLLSAEVDRLFASRQITIAEIQDETTGSKTVWQAKVEEVTTIDRDTALKELGIDLSQTFARLDENGKPVYLNSDGNPVPDVLNNMPIPAINAGKYESAANQGVVPGNGLRKKTIIQQHMDTYLK